MTLCLFAVCRNRQLLVCFSSPYYNGCEVIEWIRRI